MSESRVFVLNGITVQAVAARLENFFRSEKGMEVQSSQLQTGMLCRQASQRTAGKP